MAITTGQWGMIALMFVVACAPLVVFLIRLALKLRAQSKASSTVAVDATANYTPPGNGLQQAKQAAALVSFGVQGGAAAVGWLFMVFGLWSNFVPQCRGQVVDACWPINFMTNMIPWPPGGTLLLLSVRPTDGTAVVVATSVLMLMQSFFFVGPTPFVIGYQLGAPGHPMGFLPFVTALINFFCLLSTIPNLICSCCGCENRMPSTRVKLARLWRSYRFFCVSMAFFFTNIGLTATRVYGPKITVNETESGYYPGLPGGFEGLPGQDPGDGPPAFITAALLILVAVGMRPPVRRKVHQILGGIAAKGEARAAAAVAGLVGGRSPTEALKHGTETFCGLPLTGLSEGDFTTSSDTGLHAKTVKVGLGEVHAFLSHSWHDDPSAKWTALSAWGNKNAGALLWLDKACIDQQKIDESLAALPVYLSGCKELLIVVGPTYTRRLWCVMELFVFLQMGGSLERVTALALPGKEVQQELATFDAAKAQCFKQEDRERLLGIVEGAFGDFGAFNMKVRKIFAKRTNTVDNFAKKEASKKYQVAPAAPSEEVEEK